MKTMQNILVGLDLARGPLTTAGLGPISREAFRRGVELAKLQNARLLLFTALNVNEEALRFLKEHERNRVVANLADAADRVLRDLEQEAKGEGVQATRKLVSGKGWLEIIKQVLRDKHDLVVVGTREPSAWRRLLFGNTAMKLLRRCPCPVLVNKLGISHGPTSLLIATDLKPSSQEALRLGIALAIKWNAHVDVLHVVEYPLDRLWATALPDARETDYHAQVRAEAEKLLQQQLEKTEYQRLGSKLKIHLVDGDGLPDISIQHFLQVHGNQLLVMGTIARGGIQGIMIGNTAERLLPEVHCSVLAVKPPDFVCPIKLES
jgi:universal stress protein E